MRNQKYEKYLSLKWTEEFNCWAFIRHITKEEFGWDIPDFWKSGISSDEAIISASESPQWQKVEEPKEGIFIILSHGQQGNDHIGMMIDEFDFIHNRAGIGVVIEPLERWRKRSRVKGLWKYVA